MNYQQAIEQQDKARIYELMRQGKPIPPKLLPMIADVLEYKKPVGRPKRQPELLTDMSNLIEYLNRYDELTGELPSDEKKLQGKIIEQMAKECNKSPSHIKNILLRNRRATDSKNTRLNETDNSKTTR